MARPEDFWNPEVEQQAVRAAFQLRPITDKKTITTDKEQKSSGWFLILTILALFN